MSTKHLTIGDVHIRILCALGRYHYLTAGQVTRLLYPNLHDANRYAQRKLKELADAKYALKLNALPKPQFGAAPLVYTLASKGRKLLAAHGVSVMPYFRPSEEIEAAQNRPFMQHTLDAIDVLIAADRLTNHPAVTCPRLLTERELKRGALRVLVPAVSGAGGGHPHRVSVIPDGWFQLSLHNRAPYSIALELDRGTEDQKAWRQKVASLAYWADGPYQEAFGTDNVTIAVVCPDYRRRDVLVDWTRRELASRNLADLSDLFLFTEASPVALSPVDFFFSPVWRSVAGSEPQSLLEFPKLSEPEPRYLYP